MRPSTRRLVHGFAEWEAGALAEFGVLITVLLYLDSTSWDSEMNAVGLRVVSGIYSLDFTVVSSCPLSNSQLGLPFESVVYEP